MEDGGWSGGGRWTLDCGFDPRPRFQILLKVFLRLEVVGDDDDGAVGKHLAQQRSKEWLGCRRQSRNGQRAARLQSPGKGLHGGSFSDPGEQTACRRDLEFLRQACGPSQ